MNLCTSDLFIQQCHVSRTCIYCSFWG